MLWRFPWDLRDYDRSGGGGSAGAEREGGATEGEGGEWGTMSRVNRNGRKERTFR